MAPGRSQANSGTHLASTCGLAPGRCPCKLEQPDRVEESIVVDHRSCWLNVQSSLLNFAEVDRADVVKAAGVAVAMKKVCNASYDLQDRLSIAGLIDKAVLEEAARQVGVSGRTDKAVFEEDAAQTERGRPY